MAEASKERRKAERSKIHIPVHCRQFVNGKPVGSTAEVASKDLSVSGIAFETGGNYPIDSIFLMDIHLPGKKEPVSCQAKIVSISSNAGGGRYLIGANFMDIKQEDRSRIASCIDDINLFKMLDEVVAKEASDLHLTVGHPPFLRLRNKLVFMEAPPIEDGQIKAMVYPLLTTEQIAYFEKHKELNFAFSPKLESRFRGNLHIQRGFAEATLRNIPTKTKTFDELGFPPRILEHLSMQKAGLLLISGKTGSGKTTTVAAMVDYINNNLEKVIITIEDPIEYIFNSKKSIIKQREMGNDTESYPGALTNSLRQDPDVIIVGELLTAETVSAALRAAETGHLVIATIHAPDVIQTLDRVVNFFQPEYATSVCQQLAFSLIGVLSQRLVPDFKENLVVASELMIVTPSLKNMISERRFSQIRNSMQTGKDFGMYTLQSQLNRLRERGIISSEVMQENMPEL